MGDGEGMIGGHVGKILKVDLTTRDISTIPTEQYEQWIGGFGMGMAVWFDEVDHDYITDTHDKTGFEPENVIGIFSGPQQGTLCPGGSRCEVVALAPQASPRPQFSRSNFGGKFGAFMKFAGFDGIVIKGASATPVWLNIVNENVTIEDATSMWGTDTYEAQEMIWQRLSGTDFVDWYALESGIAGATTQRPAIVTIGQAGETLSRLASLQHETGSGAGCGGFGAVFGSKKLKAISVVGSQSVPVADPYELMDTRMWLRNRIKAEPDNLGGAINSPKPGVGFSPGWGVENQGRPMSCYGCDQGCRQNPKGYSPDGFPLGAGMQCVDTYIAQTEDKRINGKCTEYSVYGDTYCQRYGINDFEMSSICGQKVSGETLKARGGTSWLRNLWDRGVIGPIGSGRRVETSLDFSQENTKEFIVELMRRVACAEEIGADIAMGQVRCAEKWGVLEDEMMSGRMNMIYAAGETHWGIYPSMAYAGLFQVRDCNWHMHNTIDQGALASLTATGAARDTMLKNIKSKTDAVTSLGYPWYDPMMFDQSEEGVYSLGMARYVSFTQRMAKFWRDCAMTCDQDNVWKNWQHDQGNADPEQASGLMPDFFTRFFNAVTGLGWTWEDGLDMGKKIWDFERAILALHGRHRNEEYFPPFPPYDSYVYHDGQPYLQTAASGGSPTNPQVETVWDPSLNDGQGAYTDGITAFPLSRTKMDEFKTAYYELEGWDIGSGRPTRALLEASGLGYVADVLAAKGRLGAAASASVVAGARSGAPTATVSIKTSATTARLGKRVLLSGVVKSESPVGQKVLVYVKKPGKKYWSYVSTRTSFKVASGGAWRHYYTFKKGTKKGTYQFKTVYLHAESPVTKVKVR
jgi:aldehyde:ferredoxin oxidoreductase